METYQVGGALPIDAESIAAGVVCFITFLVEENDVKLKPSA